MKQKKQKSRRVLEFVHQSALGDAKVWTDLGWFSRFKRAAGHLLGRPEWMCYGQAFSTWVDAELEWELDNARGAKPGPIDYSKLN